MSFIGLGSRVAQGALDTSGQNPGNWTIAFGPNVLNINVPSFECYHLVSTGAALNATFNVYVNNNLWDVSVYARQSSWDPSQPMVLQPGDTLSFYFSTVATDGFTPSITAWFRYDPALSQVYGL